MAACRAVLFASLVDDPQAHADQFPTDELQNAERQRLFRIIEELVKWENSTDEDVLKAARAEIMRSTDGIPPPVLDAFSGGGSILLEAQRLGLEAHGSDLNPVAVLITKALVELPPKFADMPPVNSESLANAGITTWRGAQGLAEDVRHYGHWIRDQAEARIGHLYPKVKLPAEHGGGEATVVAWLWARTVRSPNPAFANVHVPLISTFRLSSKSGKEVHVEPVIENGGYRFTVRSGKPTDVRALKYGTRAGAAQDFLCLMSGAPVMRSYIREEGKAGRLGVRLMAVVAQGSQGRVYLSPADETSSVALQPHEAAVVAEARATFLSGLTPTRAMITGGVCSAYGLTTWGSLFTDRQLVALTTFSDLIAEARQLALHDAEVSIASGSWVLSASDDPGSKASSYADALATYLSFIVDRCADYGNALTSWRFKDSAMRSLFAKQAFPMVWDYAEGNPFGSSSSAFDAAAKVVAGAVAVLPARGHATVEQLDAATAPRALGASMVCTDPPYYDNIGYADLSDFFYVWMRRSLAPIYPSVLSTLLTPKAPELVATAYRFRGGAEEAGEFFDAGLGKTFARLRAGQNADYPLTVFYAFKQTERIDGADGVVSTGWEKMIRSLLNAGLSIEGTWPMRTEGDNRSVGIGRNALASSVVLVCRPRRDAAPLASRREFLGALKAELPGALRHLQHGNIAPVDLAQASIGPGMAVFSRYSKVMEADGSQMSVRSALALINQMLDEILSEQEGEFDADTRWAIAWFEQFGMQTGEFGDAETLSRAKGTSVEGMVQAGFLEAKAGKVRLLGRDELDEDWDPATDKRLTVWEMTQHLLRRLDEGEAAAAALARQLGSFAEVARDLAYRLYLVCERKKWSQEGQAYNGLVVAWPQIQQLAATVAPSAGTTQEGLF